MKTAALSISLLLCAAARMSIFSGPRSTVVTALRLHSWWASSRSAPRHQKQLLRTFIDKRSLSSSSSKSSLSLSSSSSSSPPFTATDTTLRGGDDNDDDNQNNNNNESLSSSIYVRESDVVAKLRSSFLRTMRDRGFLHQCTALADLDAKLCESSPSSAYLGFDATADSLHVGSLLQIMILRHLQKSGHRPIVLIGGGTSKVGDPTGKDESRVMLTEDVIARNTNGISKVFEKFLVFGNQNPTDALMVNNDEWLSQLKYLEFLREYGTHFTINRMLSFDSVKQRLEREAPFTFLEFNYMILQAYDFLELYRRHKAILQLGGSDQWGNMVSGTELGRRIEGVQLFALTAPLITTSDGKKMGKTANGAVWLNADKLSEYEYWQFWRNTADADVARFLKLFTELPLEQIAEIENLQGADINRAKVVLADQATALLHGEDCLQAIHETVQTMFEGAGASTEGLPRVLVKRRDLGKEGGIKLLDLFVDLGLAGSKKEARRLIQGGGARIGDDSKVQDENAALTAAAFGDSAEVTLRAGKKRAGVVQLVD